MENKDIVEKAKKFAIESHEDTNHLYDGKPYSFHLKMAVQYGRTFLYLIPNDDRDNVIGGIWTHDVQEDCRKTRNDVAKETNEVIAELSYALTNEKGRNRKQRANSKYYRGIRATKYAVFCKLCDRLANVEYSLSKGTDSKMFINYKKENFDFIINLTKPNNLILQFSFWVLSLIIGKRSYRQFLIKNNPYKDMIYFLELMLKTV